MTSWNRNGRVVLLVAMVCGACGAVFGQAPAFTRTEDVIYGRKYGTALTMDVFTPREKANGAGVVWVVSGGWISSHEAIGPKGAIEFLRRGYTVFAVVHGCQPKYTIPEILLDLNRSIRFIRHNAARYGVDPNRLGITGGSAGGHLSLMIGMAGDSGRAKSKDPIDHESSRVQAVACFYPPTDLLNYGEPGRDVFTVLEQELKAFKAPFDFHQLNKETGRFDPVTDHDRRMQIARNISPITHVTPDDPPTLIFHGDADKLVPIQQSLDMEQKLKEAHVPVKLVVKVGAKHGWEEMEKDRAAMADWFDQYLSRESVATRPASRAAE